MKIEHFDETLQKKSHMLEADRGKCGQKKWTFLKPMMWQPSGDHNLWRSIEDACKQSAKTLATVGGYGE